MVMIGFRESQPGAPFYTRPAAAGGNRPSINKGMWGKRSYAIESRQLVGSAWRTEVLDRGKSRPRVWGKDGGGRGWPSAPRLGGRVLGFERRPGVALERWRAAGSAVSGPLPALLPRGCRDEDTATPDCWRVRVLCA